MTEPAPLRIANCSGFFGDRVSAAREMVEGGPIDVLTGDWLAELTMLILAGQRARRPERGYARTFLTQMEEVLGTCVDRGVRVVSNAGGLNPRGCAEAVAALAERLGVSVRVAHVEGDDLLGRLDDLRAAGEELRHLDTGETLEEVGAVPATAHAYLGGWGIADALGRGADVVVTGRVTDAALVMGPSAWHFGWARDDWDRLAGSLVAGHIVECGAQATGGNYAFFQEVPGLEHVGFPIAEMHADGSAVITKHPGTGGLVSVGTVTAQLLYEIGGVRYANPDVIARFDTISLAPDGPDRVRVSGVRGEPAPDTTKVAITYPGGYRNSVTFVITGLDVEEKAALAERTLWSSIPGGRDAFDEVDVALTRCDRPDPTSNDEALCRLTITVKDPDAERVGRAFSDRAVEMMLASYPGMFGGGPPTDARPFGVYWPALVAARHVTQTVVLDGESHPVEPPPLGRSAPVDVAPADVAAVEVTPPADGPTARVPLGRVAGARSGDKGGNANVGVWVRSDEAYAWLEHFLTVERLRELISEARDLPVERHPLPNLRAINFVVVGLLGRGVADSTRTDPQAKGLGEYLRAKVVDVPTRLLDGPDAH